MQLRMHHSSQLLKILFFVLFIVSLFCVNQARAESGATDPLSFIAGLGPITFSQGGGALLPPQVLSSMAQGQISPIMQYVLLSSMNTQAVKKALSLVPDQRDPYVIAKGKFDYGICLIKKNFQTGLVIALLPSLQSGGNGSNDPAQAQGSQAQALAMAQAFSKDQGCAGSGADNGFDPNILQLITSIQQH